MADIRPPPEGAKVSFCSAMDSSDGYLRLRMTIINAVTLNHNAVMLMTNVVVSISNTSIVVW